MFAPSTEYTEVCPTALPSFPHRNKMRSHTSVLNRGLARSCAAVQWRLNALDYPSQTDFRRTVSTLPLSRIRCHEPSTCAMFATSLRWQSAVATESTATSPASKLSIWAEMLVQLQAYSTKALQTTAIAPTSTTADDSRISMATVAAQAREYFTRIDAEHIVTVGEAVERDRLENSLSTNDAIELSHLLLSFGVSFKHSVLAPILASKLTKEIPTFASEQILEIAASCSRLRHPHLWYSAIPRDELVKGFCAAIPSLNWQELLRMDRALHALQENAIRSTDVLEHAIKLLKESPVDERRDRLIAALPQLGIIGAQLISRLPMDWDPLGVVLLLEAMGKSRHIRTTQLGVVHQLIQCFMSRSNTKLWSPELVSRALSFYSVFTSTVIPEWEAAIVEFLKNNRKSFTTAQVSELLEALAVAGLTDSGKRIADIVCDVGNVAKLIDSTSASERTALLRALAVAGMTETAIKLVDSLNESQYNEMAAADLRNLLHGLVYLNYFPKQSMIWAASVTLQRRQDCTFEDASAIVYGLSQAEKDVVPREVFSALARRVSTIVKFAGTKTQPSHLGEQITPHNIAMLLRGFEAVHFSAENEPKLFQFFGDFIAKESTFNDIQFSVRDCASLLLVVHNLSFHHEAFVRSLTNHIRTGVPTLSAEDVVFVAECLSHTEARDIRLTQAMAARLVTLKDSCTAGQIYRFLKVLVVDRMTSVFEAAELHQVYPLIQFEGKEAALLASFCAKADQKEKAVALAELALKSFGLQTQKTIPNSQEPKRSEGKGKSKEKPQAKPSPPVALDDKVSGVIDIDVIVNVLRALPNGAPQSGTLLALIRQRIQDLPTSAFDDVLVAAVSQSCTGPAGGWTASHKQEFLLDFSRHALENSASSPVVVRGAATATDYTQTTCPFMTETIIATLTALVDEDLRVIPLFRLLGRPLATTAGTLSPTQAIQALAAYSKFQVRDDKVVRTLFARCHEVGIACARTEDHRRVLKSAVQVFGEAWATKDFLKKVGLVEAPILTNGKKKKLPKKKAAVDASTDV